MDAEIRALLKQHARLRVSVEQLPEDANLFEAGLDSLAMVNLMLAIEDNFGVELPDAMLSRDTFSTVASLRRAIEHLQATVG
jgi:acyl carrier protein